MTKTSEPQKRMSKAGRRTQLLDVALTIARAEGTDALTLGHLAERAGVSKPIAYEHFGTRAGLLVALCERIDERQLAVLHEALDRAPRKLADIAKVASAQYMHCYVTVGPEWHALLGALQGDEVMNAYQRTIVARYVDVFRKALAPYSKLGAAELRRRCVGIIGAAEAISRDMLAGQISEAAASQTLAAILSASVSS